MSNAERISQTLEYHSADYHEDDDDYDEERSIVDERGPFLKNNIFYAAQDGLAITLYTLLEQGMDYVNQEFEENDGQVFSPLVIAARNGRYGVVKMLLSNFAPNLEQECTVKFEGHLIQGATALWCAAVKGHLNIIKLLVEHGANVNHKTKTQSTPLRAACFDGRLDVVKYLVAHNADVNIANGYNNTCLMISSYRGHTDVVEFLLESGAIPDIQAKCGATALHYAAECGHVDICKALLDYSMDLKKNEYGMTAAITAAERTRELVVDLFYEKANLLNKQEKIDVLELMGASFANDKDNYSLNKAYHYLMQAMELRYEDSNNIVRKPILPPVSAYENWIECQTIQDLRAIRNSDNSLHMESLTIRERILTRKCPDVAHPVVFRGAVFADNGRFDRCEILWLHALELRQNNKLSVQRDLLRFAQVFSQMIHGAITLRLSNVLAVLQSCIRELDVNKDKFKYPGPKDDLEIVMEEYELNVVTALYLCTIITKLLKQQQAIIENAEKLSSHTLIFKLNKMNLKLRDGQTLLHLAVNGVTPVDDFHTNDVCRFPCADTVRLLLKCGASILVFDCSRNSPLHTLTATTARTIGSQMIEVVEEITELFVHAGLHLDSVNVDGLTAAQLGTSPLIETLIRRYESNETSLLCLSSRCIAQHKIPYKDIVPKHLETFIQLHCADKL